MEQIQDYKIIEQLDKTLHSVVYRARKEGENHTVIIKTLRTQFPSPAEIARLKHEYELIRGIDIQGIIRVFDVIDFEDGVALVMEDFGGVSLKKLIAGSFTLERFLNLATRTSEILGSLHQRNITHRDIKPGNILLNQAEDILKITDFGIAAEITRQNEEIYSATVIEGTLAYMSPEQTGRMNCAVDYRTDLYSLGVTFYEMLTGKVPFMSDDPMEIIHAHMAKAPVAPHAINPEVPHTVSDIIIKLLSKTPEERYQNSFGLMADLKVCLDQLKATGRIKPFDLARYDISLKFNIPQILVGRESETALLFEAFERISAGAMEIMLVTGEPGIGKSALVNEIHKPIVGRRGYFLSGKYDQFRKYVPYSSIIQAFQGLARQLLSESTERLEVWRGKLLSALGPNGKIITEAIPEVELIIGPQADLPELGPEESQNRFNLVFKNFVKVFADSTHPLVVFLDDLQWADSASLNLIQAITTDKSIGHFLFIGAYRDNEVAAHHPLMLTIDEIRTKGISINSLNISGLKETDVNRITANLLRCEPHVSEPLAAIIYEKTLGNPFFVIQFLKTLYEDKYLSLDVSGWRWDIKVIREMQVTDNVVEFMANKITLLPQESRELIEVCACMGNRFDIDTLATVMDTSIDKILFTMDDLIAQGLINYSSELYRFHHDRIQEAAYSLILPQEKEKIHYRIAGRLLKMTPPDKLFAKIFYIADQYNHSGSLIATRQEKDMVAELNLTAGIKAKISTAYAAAVNYLSAGIELLAPDSWQSNYRMTYDLHKELMECEYLNRNFTEAERLFEIIIANATTKIDKAKAYNIMIVLYTNMRSPKDAVALGLKALNLFGITLKADMGPGPVLVQLIRAKLALRKIPLEKVIDLPRMQDEEIIARHELMLNTGTSAYFVNQNLFAFMSLSGVNDGIKYGHTPHSAVAFMVLATVVQTVQGDYELAYRIGEMALKLNEKLGNQRVAGLVHHVFAIFIQHWKKHARHDIEYFRIVYQLALNTGDFIYVGHSVNAEADCALMIGTKLDDILDHLQRYRDLMNIVKEPFIAARYRENIQVIRNLKGLTPDRLSMSGEGFDEQEHLAWLHKEKNIFGICYALINKTKLLYNHGAYEDACRIATELNKYIKTPSGTLMVAEHYFYYSLTLTALLMNSAHPRGRKYKAILHSNQSKMLKWANLCPENFRHKYDLVEAEITGIEGRFREALGMYHAAIDGARRNEYLHEEALACERFALFYLANGLRGEAGPFMQRAYQLYRFWGAAAKVKDLEALYPELIRTETKTDIPETLEQSTATESSSRNLDLSTVMQVSQVISSEIMLDRLLQKIMHISIANAGAQRGYLILNTDGKLTIEASEDVDSSENRVMQSIPLSECKDLSIAIVQYVHRSGQSVILGNASQEGAYMNDSYIAGKRSKSILCSPILNKGKLSGILYMENNLTANAFTPERLELISIIASQAAISLENAKLFELATTDGLTKLFVHRYFQLVLDQEIQRSRRYNKNFSLIMMDIDNFKHFNDTYGHQMGDDVLRSVARAFKTISRAEDVLARYGGEEFVMILPETDTPQALQAAEKIRANVQALEIPYGSEKLHVTISLGVATFPEHATDKDELIKAADEAMYDSKRAGKNRVSVGKSGGKTEADQK